MSNEKKSATLGVPHGTATNKLRKNIMFSLLCRLGENDCYRCKRKIESVDVLSIEHKLPWEGVSAELFWDLDNIAFSHIACNRPHSYPSSTVLRKIGPEGTAWCIGHQAFEPTEKFYQNSTRWNGFQGYCKESRIR
jgi:hypothetical protein